MTNYKYTVIDTFGDPVAQFIVEEDAWAFIDTIRNGSAEAWDWRVTDA